MDYRRTMHMGQQTCTWAHICTTHIDFLGCTTHMHFTAEVRTAVLHMFHPEEFTIHIRDMTHIRDTIHRCTTFT